MIENVPSARLSQSTFCCYNKMPKAKELFKEGKKMFIVQFLRLEVQGQVTPSTWPLVRAFLVLLGHSG